MAGRSGAISASCAILLHQSQRTPAPYYPEQVLAVFPDTTSFYRGTISKQPVRKGGLVSEVRLTRLSRVAFVFFNSACFVDSILSSCFLRSFLHCTQVILASRSVFQLRQKNGLLVPWLLNLSISSKPTQMRPSLFFRSPRSRVRVCVCVCVCVFSMLAFAAQTS